MPTTTAANPELGRKYVQKFVEGYTTKNPTVYKQYMGEVVSTTLNQYMHMEETGMGTAVETAEGANIGVDSFTTRNRTTLTGVKRALAFDVTAEAVETDQFGVIEKRAMKMARAFQKTREIVFTNAFFNNAFTSTGLVPAATANNLYSSSGLSSGTGHVTEAPGIRFNNRGVLSGSSYADVALGYFPLELAIQTFTAAVDAKGIPDPIFGNKILVVPTALQGIANRIVNSAKVAGTTDNDVAWAAGQVAKVVVNPFLTSTTAWFLVDAAENPFFELNRRGYKVVMKDNRADNDSYKYTGTEIYAPGVWRAQGCWGSTGA